jgi:flagellar assembly factor FliW
VSRPLGGKLPLTGPDSRLFQARGISTALLQRMKTAQLEPSRLAHDMDGASIALPMGLLGFEKTKRFILHTMSAEDPLLWFEVADSPGKGFYVLSPTGCSDHLVPELCSQDREFLGLTELTGALVLHLATVGPGGVVTLHPRAPIVVNPLTRIGKQVVPNNIDQIPASQPLDMLAAVAA